MEIIISVTLIILLLLMIILSIVAISIASRGKKEKNYVEYHRMVVDVTTAEIVRVTAELNRIDITLLRDKQGIAESKLDFLVLDFEKQKLLKELKKLELRRGESIDILKKMVI